MPDLQVVYDPSIQVGAIVDLDTNMGWGPICPGPEGGSLLQSFIDGMPFDITILSSEQARDIFMSVFQDQAAESIAAEGTAPAANVDAGPDTGAIDAAQATAEAVANAGAPPEPGPHDTDMEAAQGTPDTVSDDPTIGAPAPITDTSAATADASTQSATLCLVCNPNGTGSTNPSCLVCGGKGIIPPVA